MYVFEKLNNIILGEVLKDRGGNRRCGVSSTNLELMTLGFSAAVSSLAVRFTHFLISSLKRV